MVFKFSTIQIDGVYEFPCQRKTYIHERSRDTMTVGVGHYKGGDLWVEDVGGDRNMYIEGKWTQGYGINIHQRFWRINGRDLLHGPLPFTGEKFTITYYTVRQAEKASPQDANMLISLGFPALQERLHDPDAQKEIQAIRNMNTEDIKKFNAADLP